MILLYIAIFALTIFYLKKKLYSPSFHGELKQVPKVPGKLPFVGHGLDFSKDILGFTRACREKYGPIFRIKIFRSDIVVVSDRNLINEFFSQNESQMSMYNVLESLYFADAFYDRQTNLAQMIGLFKTTVGANADSFPPKIYEEAQKLISRLKERDGQNIDLIEELVRFVSRTSSSCFICLDLNEELIRPLKKFSDLLNKIVVLTYFLPRWLIKLLLNRKLRSYRRQMTSLMVDEIQKYRDDPNKTDSVIMRKAVDYEEEGTGYKLTNEEVGDVLVCLLYVSSENTALGATAAISDICRNPEWWDRVAKESATYFENNDIKGLLASPVLNSVVLESARLNSHIFALNRRPTSKYQLGEYYIPPEVTQVALCEPLLMVYNGVEGHFDNPEKYNPERFLTGGESTTPKSVMTWGAGKHLCPGKNFAIYEIKMIMALLTTNFERFHIPQVNKLNYFSPSAFAEMKLDVTPHILKQPIVVEKKENHFVTHSFDTTELSYSSNDPKVLNVQVYVDPETKEEKAWIIRDFLSRNEEKEIYKYVVDISKGSKEHDEIKDSDASRAFPFCYYNLAYTKTSNCEEPEKVFKWIDKLWFFLQSKFELPKYESGFNSLYAQLFSGSSTMDLHKDEYVDWGISLSLGASCSFQFGQEEFMLNSGDIMIADFSKTDHAVNAILDNTAPGWFGFADNTDGDQIMDVETFGKARCSIQIRNVKADQTAVTNIKDFKKMLSSRK